MPAQGRLEVVEGAQKGTVVPLAASPVTIGRAPGNGFVVADATVSRQLAKTRDTLADAVRTSLKRDHGMDDRTVAEALASAMDDTGSMDVKELIGTGPRKELPFDRSRE